MRPLVAMQRPVGNRGRRGYCGISVVRVMSGEMPEGRIQAVTHLTERTVWQPRWLTHPNGAIGLLDVVIAETHVEEATGRFRRFLDRDAHADPFARPFILTAGRVQLVAAGRAGTAFPEAVDSRSAVSWQPTQLHTFRSLASK